MITYIKNRIYFISISSERLGDFFRKSLFEIGLIPMRNNIFVNPKKLDSEANSSTNIVSQFNNNQMANICLF